MRFGILRYTDWTAFCQVLTNYDLLTHRQPDTKQLQEYLKTHGPGKRLCQEAT